MGLALSVVVAILVHASVVFPLFGWFLSREPVVRAPVTEVRYVKRSSTKAARPTLDSVERERELDRKKLVEREREKPEEIEAPGQVVRLAPPEKEEAPERADYASEWNQKTDRETKARDVARYSKNVTRQRTIGRDAIAETAPTPTEGEEVASTGSGLPSGEASDGKAETGASGDAAVDGREHEAPRFAFEIPRVAARDRLRIDESDDGTLRNREARVGVDGNGVAARLALGRDLDALERDIIDMRREIGDGAGKKRGGGGDDLPKLAQLIPSLKELERVSGAPANDYLPEVETDAETRLNAWRWKHATFFNRVADGVRRTWAGPEVLGQRDPTGRLYGSDDVMTIVQVTIDRDGNVLEVLVQEPSGHDFYDDEAIRSFKSSGPFPNPPSALFQGRDRFTFAFGFSVGYERQHIDLDWRPY